MKNKETELILKQLNLLHQKLDNTIYDERIDIKKVKSIFGYNSDTQVWVEVKKGNIPKPIIQGKRYTRWSLNDVLKAEKLSRSNNKEL